MGAGDKIGMKVGFQGVDDSDAITIGDVRALIYSPRRVYDRALAVLFGTGHSELLDRLWFLMFQ